MSELKIDKFVNGKHETTITVPIFLIGMAKMLLPESALMVALASRGIDLKEVERAKRQGGSYSIAISVRDQGADKKVLVSLV